MITFEVEGVIVGFDGPPQEPFEVGQKYIGRFTFDSDTTGTPIFGGGENYEGAITAASFTIGPSYAGTVADSTATNIRVANDHSGHIDEYIVTVNAVDAPPIQTQSGPIAPSQLCLIYLEDYEIPLDGLSSDDLPLTPPDLTEFNVAAWWLEFDSPNYYGRVRGSISSIKLIPPVVSVDIDIKPGSEPNSINPRSRGVIPVAILTTDTFDASAVSPSMVLFGATGSEAAPVQSALEDVDVDGDIDMILHFKTQETGIQYGDTSASLTGGTPDGQIIQGSNCIKTVGDGRCFPPPTGLTGWWPGDYNTDDILGGQNAELWGDATIGRGLIGGAFVLDGDGDFVDVPHDEALDVGTGDFTVDLWVFFNDTEGEQILVEKWVQREPNTESVGWTLTKLDNNVLLLAMAEGSDNGTGVSSGELPIAAGTWTHFAATRLGSEITLFMNGVPVAQGESSLNLNSDSSLKFGHRGNLFDTEGSNTDQQFYLNGRIDEVHLFVGKALTHCQIQAIFTARKAGMCK